MIDGNQLVLLFAFHYSDGLHHALPFLDQNVFFVTLAIQDANVKDCYFAYFLRRINILRVVAKHVAVISKTLQRAMLGLIRAGLVHFLAIDGMSLRGSFLERWVVEFDVGGCWHPVKTIIVEHVSSYLASCTLTA